MEAKIYGVIDNSVLFTDTSKTLRGCKRYATIHGYNKVGYRIGYNAIITHEKINGNWIDYDTNK